MQQRRRRLRLLQTLQGTSCCAKYIGAESDNTPIESRSVEEWNLSLEMRSQVF